MVGPDTLIALAPGMILLGLSAHDGIEEPIGSYIGFNRIGVCDRARLVAK